MGWLEVLIKIGRTYKTKAEGISDLLANDFNNIGGYPDGVVWGKLRNPKRTPNQRKKQYALWSQHDKTERLRSNPKLFGYERFLVLLPVGKRVIKWRISKP